MTPPARLLVAGSLQDAADGLSFPVVCPASGRVVGSVPDAGPADLESALVAARAALPAWSDDADLRARCSTQLREAVTARWDSLRDLAVAEVGTPVSLVARPSYEAGGRSVGVRAVVTPWTSPVLALEAVVDGLAVGDVVVHKPAAGAGWFACEVGRIAAEETELPAGVLQVLPSRDVDVAIALTTDPRVDGVWFAGSSVAAARVVQQAPGRVVHVDEGRAATVVVDEAGRTAETAAAVGRRVAARAGQWCGVPSRLIVPRQTVDAAVDAALDVFAAVAPGDPADPATVCGPVGSRVQRDRVRRYLALAEQEGGTLRSVGDLPDEGWWVAPTVVTGLAPAARVVQEEVLGPVLLVLPHDGDGVEVAATIPSYEVEVR